MKNHETVTTNQYLGIITKRLVDRNTATETQTLKYAQGLAKPAVNPRKTSENPENPPKLRDPREAGK